MYSSIYDSKIEERQRDYRKPNNNNELLSKREVFNLSLRKEKLNEMIMNKRLKRNSPIYSNNCKIQSDMVEYQTNKYNYEACGLNYGSFTEIDPVLLSVFTEDKISLLTNFEREINFIFQNLDWKNSSVTPNNLKSSLFLIRLYISYKEKANLNILKAQNLIEKIETIMENVNDETILYEIYWILTNFSYLGDYEENKSLISEKLLRLHYKFLDSQNLILLEQIIWLLSNIISENLDFRDIIFKTPILDKIRVIIYDSLNYNHINLLKSCSNFLFYSLNYTSLTKDLNDSIVKILQVILRLILNTSGEIFSNSLWALMHISGAEDKEYILNLTLTSLLQNNGEVLIKILSVDFDNQKTELISIVRIIGNMLSINNEQLIDNLLELNIFDFFDKILSTEKNKKIKHEIIYGISNLIRDNHKSQIKQLVESNLFSRILNLCNDYDLKLKKDAIILIYNICTITYFNLSTELVKKGTFRMMIELLEITNNPDLILYCLYSIELIIASGEFLKSVLKDNTIAKKFESCGGCDCLEKFQSNPNIEIYNKAMEILEKYFESYKNQILLIENETKNRNSSDNYIEACNFNFKELGICDYNSSNKSNFYEMN